MPCNVGSVTQWLVLLLNTARSDSNFFETYSAIIDGKDLRKRSFLVPDSESIHFYFSNKASSKIHLSIKVSDLSHVSLRIILRRVASCLPNGHVFRLRH